MVVFVESGVGMRKYAWAPGKIWRKYVKLRWLELEWAVVPLGQAVVTLEVLSGSTGSLTQSVSWRDFGAEMDDFGGKIGEISWKGSGETWGKARST